MKVTSRLTLSQISNQLQTKDHNLNTVTLSKSNFRLIIKALLRIKWCLRCKLARNCWMQLRNNLLSKNKVGLVSFNWKMCQRGLIKRRKTAFITRCRKSTRRKNCLIWVKRTKLFTRANYLPKRLIWSKYKTISVSQIKTLSKNYFFLPS